MALKKKSNKRDVWGFILSRVILLRLINIIYFIFSLDMFIITLKNLISVKAFVKSNYFIGVISDNKSNNNSNKNKEMIFGENRTEALKDIDTTIIPFVLYFTLVFCCFFFVFLENFNFHICSMKN